MLAGGLLKTVDGTSTGYVGMLMGRFAAYGLSVFGGYTKDGPNASFFVFGAINGPIGGPPAFFPHRTRRRVGDQPRTGHPLMTSPSSGPSRSSKPSTRGAGPGQPMDELHRLAAIFPHQMGNFWFAAGISFTCFSLVDGWLSSPSPSATVRDQPSGPG